MMRLVDGVPNLLTDSTGRPQLWALQPDTCHKYLQGLHNRVSPNKMYFHSKTHHLEFFHNTNRYAQRCVIA